MGVNICDRGDCDNVRCDVLIDEEYICNSCLDEFRKKMPNENINLEIWLERFRDFMDTDKDCERSGNIDDFINQYST